MCVVGSVVRGTDDGKSMGGGREVSAARVWREEGWEDSGRVEGSLEKGIQNENYMGLLGLTPQSKAVWSLKVCATCWVPATPRLCLQWRCEEVRGEMLVVIWALVEAAGLVLYFPLAVGGRSIIWGPDPTNCVGQTCEDGGGGRPGGGSRLLSSSGE